MEHQQPDHEPDIATPDEVLATFTERLKAAEQLAKYHSLFTVKEEAGISADTASEVEAAVAAILAEHGSSA